MSTNTKPKSTRASAKFEPETFGPFLLRRVSERLAKSLAEALRPHDKTPNSWRVLVALTNRRRATISELVDLTVIDQSTLSRTVDRLEEQGFVTRTSSETDGRAVVVELTEDGEEAFEALLPVASFQYEWAIRGIPQRDLEVFTATLQRMLKNIRLSPIK
jgi:MarR family transcriptional regulator, transcriptional regulator for hemolysin